VAESFRPRGEP